MYILFFKLCQHIIYFHVPGIHYRFTFSALLILGINNFQCNLDIQDLVFNLALLYYLEIFSILLCTIITGDIKNITIPFGFAFTCSKRSYSNDLPLWNDFYHTIFCYLNSWHPCQIKCLTNKKTNDYWPMAFIEYMW